MAKFLLRSFLFLLVVAAIVVGGYSLLQGREDLEDGLKRVQVVRGSITEKAVAIGQIEPRLEFKVKSKISGIVKRCAVEVGDRVEPGDTLFEIVPDPTPTSQPFWDGLAEGRVVLQRCDDCGSWKIIPISLPRIVRIRS